ncbi:MAG: hypothetical protein ACLFOY_14585 [Desulfatibacillaceae bacterium]
MNASSRLAATCAAVALLLWTAPLPAFEAGDIQLHGFVSQGYIETSDNNWLAETRDGTFQFNEAALNATYQRDRLYIGVQALSKDLGDQGNNEFELDWALGDYRLRDWFGVRAGRCKLPMGLYNQGRDVDMLRNPVFLPQTLYDEGSRDLFNVYNGVGFYGNIMLPAVGDLDYETFYGAIDVDQDGIFVRGSFEAFDRGVDAQMAKMGAATSGVRNGEIDNQFICGGALRWNLPVGLRLGASLFHGENELTGDLTVNPNGPAGPPFFFPWTMDVQVDHTMDHNIVLSAEYTWRDLVLTAEWQKFRGTMEMEFLNVQNSMGAAPPIPMDKVEVVSEAQGWYVMGSYQLFSRYTPGLIYGEYIPNEDDPDGQQRARTFNEPPYYAFHREWTAFLRVDITDNWLAKAEWHWVDGAARLYDYNNPGGREDDWTIMALKTTFYF